MKPYIYIALGTAAVAGICVYLWRRMACQQEPSAAIQPRKHDTQYIFRIFLPYAENFSGLYEPLYKCVNKTVARERMLNTLKEWDVRMGKLAHIPQLGGWWKTFGANLETCSDAELKRRLESLLQFLANGGIVRDGRKVVTVDEDTPIYYMTIDNDSLPMGAEITVDSPCWYMPYQPPRIIEKGYCFIN